MFNTAPQIHSSTETDTIDNYALFLLIRKFSLTIRTEQSDKADRMASTVRHNRARGKHSVTSMSDIVIELKRRNWSNEKIAKHLGMDSDEVLRLYQITSLTSIFKDKQFSMSWEPELLDFDNDNEIID